MLARALAAFLLLAAPAAAQQRAAAIDGDTIRVGGRTVRVIGLDAPEMRGKCPAEIRMARAARDRMAELVSGGVFITPSGRDRYRRTLAFVRDRAGRDLAQVMIAEGLARAYNGRGRRAGWCR